MQRDRDELERERDSLLSAAREREARERQEVTDAAVERSQWYSSSSPSSSPLSLSTLKLGYS